MPPLLRPRVEQLEDRRTPNIDLVSVSSTGGFGSNASFDSSVSSDGRSVAFKSNASTLVPGDTNGVGDVFLRDTRTGTTRLVSTGLGGTPSDNHSFAPSISSDGRYVAFSSFATNLVAGDSNGKEDVFVWDRRTGAITLVSTTADGTQANDQSFFPKMSANGRYVAFATSATNLVSGDTNGKNDVFVKDLRTGKITRVNTAADGTQSNGDSYWITLSADGRYAAFDSGASNLVANATGGDVLVKDLRTGKVTLASAAADGTRSNQPVSRATISADGRHVAFVSYATNLVPGDTNDMWDVFVKDLRTGTISLASTATDGTQANNNSGGPVISADGRYVAFHSLASNLVAGDTNHVTDVFVKDLRTGITTRVSTSADGVQGDRLSEAPSISLNGRYVAFDSSATTLVPGDTNHVTDVFLAGTRRPHGCSWHPAMTLSRHVAALLGDESADDADPSDV